MAEKTHPFTRDQLEAIAAEYPTPFHIYDETAMRMGARRLNVAFAWAPEFKNYFAVKACPNPQTVYSGTIPNRLQADYLNRASSVSAPANVMAAGTDQIFDH